MRRKKSVTALEKSDADTSAAMLSRLFDDRRSCRQFRSEPVPRETVERMLTMAQRSPSWCNTQPWQLIVTEGAATDAVRDLLRANAAEPAQPDLAFPPSYEGIYQERRRECGWALYESVGIARGDREASTRQAMRNLDLFDAPHFALLTTTRSLGVYGVLDCGVYLGGLLLAAESLGVATIAQAAVAGFSPQLRAHFELADDRQVVCGIAFGYAQHDAPANQFSTTRASLADVVTWRR